MFRRLGDILVGVIATTLFLGFFFEDEHRTYEGFYVTLAITVVITFFCVGFIGVLKLANLERGGVYGMAHSFAERHFPTPWSPIYRVITLPLAVGLGSLLGGLVRQRMVGTLSFAIVVGSLSAFIVLGHFKKQYLRKRDQKT